MRVTPIEPLDTDIELLLANERTIEHQPDDLRHRAVERARAELAGHARHPFPEWRRSSKPRRLTAAIAVAAGVMLVAMCAVAFRPLYRSFFNDQVAPGKASQPPAREGKAQIPAPAPATVPETSTPSEPVQRFNRSNRSFKTKVSGKTTSAEASETYALEFALLRPAYDAVARHDFASALAAIAAHQRRFASGRLAEEREALRVKALLGLGRRTDAQQAASAFRERFPRSVLLQRIESMLGPPP